MYDSKQTIIGSDSGLSPSRRQAIIWTNAANRQLDHKEHNSGKF